MGRASQVQIRKLATSYNHCLGRIVWALEDRHTLSDIYDKGASEPLELTTAKRVTPYWPCPAHEYITLSAPSF